jgi:hypothetical protein
MPSLTARASAALATVALAAAAVPGQATASPTATVCPTGPPACQFATIPDAIAAVDEGGLVSVAAGAYAGGFAITKSVRMVGAGATATRIGGESVTVAAGVSVVLRAVTIADATTSAQIVNEGNLTLRDSVVSAVTDPFTSPAPPVAGVWNQGTLTLYGSTVSGRGGHVGGILNDGIAVLNSSTVRLSSGNVGGVQNNGALTLHASHIVDNDAGFDGGIRNEGSLVARDSDISRNAGQGPGGLANGLDAEAVIVDTTMRDNELSGIFNDGSLTLRRVTLSGWGSGLGSVAGIWNEPSGSAVIAYSTLDGGDVQYSANRTPPAIENEGEMVLNASTVRDSHSTGSGGGVANSGALTLRYSTVTGNISDRSGGGIYNTGSLVLRWSTVTGNTALDLLGTGLFGGGIANVAPGALVRRDTVVAGNTPDDCAGC